MVTICNLRFPHFALTASGSRFAGDDKKEFVNFKRQTNVAPIFDDLTSMIQLRRTQLRQTNFDDPKIIADRKDSSRRSGQSAKMMVTLVTVRQMPAQTIAQNFVAGFLPCFFGFHTLISCMYAQGRVRSPVVHDPSVPWPRG
jgi:hypothetical protein